MSADTTVLLSTKLQLMACAKPLPEPMLFYHQQKIPKKTSKYVFKRREKKAQIIFFILIPNVFESFVILSDIHFPYELEVSKFWHAHLHRTELINYEKYHLLHRTELINYEKYHLDD